MMTCINVAEFVLISLLKKDHGMIETRRLKNVVIFIQTILSFVLSRKIRDIRSVVNVVEFHFMYRCIQDPTKHSCWSFF